MDIFLIFLNNYQVDRQFDFRSHLTLIYFFRDSSRSGFGNYETLICFVRMFLSAQRTARDEYHFLTACEFFALSAFSEFNIRLMTHRLPIAKKFRKGRSLLIRSDTS